MDQKKKQTNSIDTEKVKVVSENKKANDTKAGKWEKPTIEDVSGRVMAQPYIRFT